MLSPAEKEDVRNQEGSSHNNESNAAGDEAEIAVKEAHKSEGGDNKKAEISACDALRSYSRTMNSIPRTSV